MKSKKKNILIACSQYLVFLMLAIPCFLLWLFVFPFYVMRLENLFTATDAMLPPFLNFLMTSLDLFFQNCILLLVLILFSIIGYEIFYKRKNKNKIRFGILLFGVLVIFFYTTCIPSFYIPMIMRSVNHPRIHKTIKTMINEKYKENPNK